MAKHDETGSALGQSVWNFLSEQAWWDRNRGRISNNAALDMRPDDWRGLMGGLARFFEEEDKEGEHTDTRALLTHLLKFFAEEQEEAEHDDVDAVAPDPAMHSAGILYFAKADDGDKVLLVKRAPGGNFPGYWAIPGGGIEEGETPVQAARRESDEEIGRSVSEGDLSVVDEKNGYVAFRANVDSEFTPTLNEEHTDWGWFALDRVPAKTHPCVVEQIERATAPVAMPPITGDSAHGFYAIAMDRAIGPFVTKEIAARAYDLETGRMPAGLAFDRSSTRTMDADGRLHLESTHISKACVNPYKGEEIPDHERLGLEPNKIYRMLRDPQELEKAAATFNGLPLLIKHVEVTADDHKPDIVVGATGSNATFNAPYLDVALVIWSQKAINDVEDGSKRELSSAYRYDPDMTPGVFEGESYDGVMRNIVGNHVCLVSQGRAGSDVLVADESLKEKEMAKRSALTATALLVEGALRAHLMPRLAKDAALDLYPVVKDITAKNFKDRKAAIWKGAKDAADPLLAPEAKADGGVGPDHVAMRLLDMLEGAHGAGTSATDPNAAPPPGAGNKSDDDDAPGSPANDCMDAACDWARKKGLTEDDVAELASIIGTPAKKDDDMANQQTTQKNDGPPKDDDNSKAAMDAAIDAKVKEAVAAANKRHLDANLARQAVRPFVGEVPLAMDSAEAIYKHALEKNGVKVDGVHPSAFPAMLAMVKKGDADAGIRSTVVTMDAAGVAASDQSYDKMFPEAGRFAS